MNCRACHVFAHVKNTRVNLPSQLESSTVFIQLFFLSVLNLNRSPGGLCIMTSHGTLEAVWFVLCCAVCWVLFISRAYASLIKQQGVKKSLVTTSANYTYGFGGVYHVWRLPRFASAVVFCQRLFRSCLRFAGHRRFTVLPYCTFLLTIGAMCTNETEGSLELSSSDRARFDDEEYESPLAFEPTSTPASRPS